MDVSRAELKRLVEQAERGGFAAEDMIWYNADIASELIKSEDGL